MHSWPGEPKPAKPRAKQTPPELTTRQIDKFTQPGWAIDLVGKWDEETQSIVPFTKADRVRLALDKKVTSSPARPRPSSGTSVDAAT